MVLGYILVVLYRLKDVVLDILELDKKSFGQEVEARCINLLSGDGSAESIRSELISIFQLIASTGNSTYKNVEGIDTYILEKAFLPVDDSTLQDFMTTEMYQAEMDRRTKTLLSNGNITSQFWFIRYFSLVNDVFYGLRKIKREKNVERLIRVLSLPRADLALIDEFQLLKKGASTVVLRKQLSRVAITQEQFEEKLQCYFCFEEYRVGELVTSLSCSHLYHTDCIKLWLPIEKTCPCCRRRVDFIKDFPLNTFILNHHIF
nr:RING finger protein 150 isoform X2 [Parasteatoda tepidariorum]